MIKSEDGFVGENVRTKNFVVVLVFVDVRS